jgi:hypothetical protein
MMHDALQRFAVSLSLGLVLLAIGHGIDSWQFWSILALLLVSNHIHYRDGFETGVVHGMEIIADMTEAQRTDLIRTVRAVQQEHDQ